MANEGRVKGGVFRGRPLLKSILRQDDIYVMSYALTTNIQWM